MKITTIKPGSIILWKEHGWLRRLVYMVLGKELPYNAYVIVDKEIELLFRSCVETFPGFIVLSPRKQYSKAETSKLQKVNMLLTPELEKVDAALSISYVINGVRKDTFEGINDIDLVINSKYYKLINATKEK